MVYYKRKGQFRCRFPPSITNICSKKLGHITLHHSLLKQLSFLELCRLSSSSSKQPWKREAIFRERQKNSSDNSSRSSWGSQRTTIPPLSIRFSSTECVMDLDQRCPTLSPFATYCDKRFKCGERQLFRNGFLLINTLNFSHFLNNSSDIKA